MDNLEQEWRSFKQVIIHASKQSIPRVNFKHLKSYFQHRDPGLRTLILKRNALHRKLTLTGAMDLRKSPGPEGIDGFMIGHLGPHGMQKFLDMFRISWKIGRLPRDWGRGDIRGRALPWISDFLWDRSIRVKYNNCLSDSFAIRQGVPQGSVLSPILLSLYITGIEKVLAKHFEVGIFADDIIVWTLNLSSSDVEPHSLSFKGAGLELDGIYFHDQLLTSVTKNAEIPALVNQLPLETINGIPQYSLKIYTYGSRGQKGILGSGVYIPTPSGALEFKIKNPNYCSAFRSELISIKRGLQRASQLEDRFQEIWILTDSQASIQHLANWGDIGVQTSLDILIFFMIFLQDIVYICSGSLCILA
ncbi:uncharacterized protein TNCV_1982271 [Trichonephila clavipes]|nr:uncharacterized protein TNCV_1982271 [Trichonephila clavipes]